jgi:hypothetical protein
MAVTVVNAFSTIANHNRLLQDLKDAIKNKVFFDEAENFFRIQPGIKGGQQVVALDPLEYVTKKESGCGDTAQSYSMSGIEQKWEPQLAKVNIKMCYSEFASAFTRWGLANGYDIHNLGEAEFFNFILDMVVDAMKADFVRIALFGDVSIASQDILAAEAKEPYYDVINKGLIPTLQYFSGLAALEDQFVTLTKNSAIDRATQMTLDADYALTLFESLTDNQYFESDQILTSHSLYKNYKNYLRKSLAPLESSKQGIQEGMESLKFDGEQLKAIKFYDKKRLEDFTKGNGETPEADVTHLPHFALNTSRDNLVIGVDDLDALTDLRLEYIGGSDEHFYIKGNYQVDFKIPNPKALRAAL